MDGYDLKTMAEDMLALLKAESVERFHILSHDLGGPPSVALAYSAGDRVLSLATIETPFFGVEYPGYVDPTVSYWHLVMHMHVNITASIIQGREDMVSAPFLPRLCLQSGGFPRGRRAT